MIDRRMIVGLVFAALLFLGIGQASAQVRLGVKGGLNIASVHFSTDVLQSDNVTGFQIGPMIEGSLPLVGLGFDAAILYAQKGLETKTVSGEKTSLKNDYIDVPVNLKWKLGLPIMKVYLAAGPYVGFRVGGNKIWELPGSMVDQVKTKSFSAGLNFGAGVELISHLQVGLNYGLGLTNNYSMESLSLTKSDGKNRGWSVTAAILF
ncbi:PorT family protein [Parabacteroides distasonis]|nr:PorT family protein [Parabacteroides distasonis]